MSEAQNACFLHYNNSQLDLLSPNDFLPNSIVGCPTTIAISCCLIAFDFIVIRVHNGLLTRRIGVSSEVQLPHVMLKQVCKVELY
jgi:hypothetical protein